VDPAGPPFQTPHKGYHFAGRQAERFFEGWYWRITLPGDAKSFALIYSIEDPLGDGVFSGVGAQVMGPDDGYILQYSKDVSTFWADRGRLALGASFQPTEAGGASCVGGMLPERKFSERVGEGFQASATFHQGKIVAREEGAAGDLRSTVPTCRWEFSIQPRYGWGAADRKQQSTAGWLSALPIFEPHWQVLMAHGEATGWIEWGERRYEFTGAPAYSEKNWGGGFPNKWIWIQCNSFLSSPGTSVTAVGAERGLMQVENFTENVGLIGIHHEGQFYELNIKDSSIRWEASPWGQWKIQGRSEQYEAIIEASCSSDDGTPLRAPTSDRGLAPCCKDSFAGDVRLRLWDRKSGAQIIDIRSDGKSGAVEVGGGPWDGTWQVDAEMSQVVKQLLGFPINPIELLPDFMRPPGY
jgi:tocopherol cyclase